MSERLDHMQNINLISPPTNSRQPLPATYRREMKRERTSILSHLTLLSLVFSYLFFHLSLFAPRQRQPTPPPPHGSRTPLILVTFSLSLSLDTSAVTTITALPYKL